MSSDPRRDPSALLAHVARIVAATTRPFGPIAAAGALGAVAILVALGPWLLTSDDEGASAWVALAVVGLAGPARLLWHRRRLRHGIGDPQRALAEVGGSAWRTAAELPRRLARVEADAERTRGFIASLRDLRALRAVLSVAGLTGRARALYGPLTPPQLWLTGIAALAIAATVAAAPFVVVASVLLALAT